MRRLLVFQHEAGDDLRQWRGLFREAGIRSRIVDFSRRPETRPDLRGAAGLVLLGGSMDVHEARTRPHLSREMKLVREAAATGLPVLGICLGAQLTAQALGGKVFKSRRPEIGWYGMTLRRPGRRDPFTCGLGPATKVFQWHSYAFSPPSGAATLAASRECPHQAFRLGNVLAAQFHFEVGERTILDWLQSSSGLTTARKTAIEDETRRFMARSNTLGRQMWNAFLELVHSRATN